MLYEHVKREEKQMSENIIEVHIRTKEKELEKETKFSMGDVNDFQKTLIIHNIFKAIGVDNDLSQMVEDYVKIGKAYHSFFKEVNPIEQESDLSVVHKLHNSNKGNKEGTIAERVGFYQKEEKADNTVSKENSHPDFYETGIKEENGIKKYRVRVKCSCGREMNRYITPNEVQILCIDCGKFNQVRPATKEGFPNRDSWGNFFIAGEFKRDDEL